ncbi:UNVERIFIED_CONTAM: hypothetical protein FKN15_013722 [Acipenser sinensis]
MPTQPLLLSTGPQPKMPRYNVITSLEVFITQFECIAEAHTWPEQKRAYILAQSLERATAEVLLDLDPGEKAC